MLEQQLVGKSFQKWPPVFDHFCICWCKVARCFPKRLHFWPLATLQRKSLPNLTPLSGPILEERKVCELIARWRCHSTLHSQISVKQGPEEKKVKGFNLSAMRLATSRYCSIVSTGHKGTYQTNCLKWTFNSTSPLVGCGEVRFGRVQTKVPSLPIIGTWVGPWPKRGRGTSGVGW